MFELLFVLGMIAWMLEMLVEYLSELPVFPTLAAAAVLIPLLAALEYQASLARHFLESVGEDRAPVPPEVFRWRLVRPRWRKSIAAAALLLPAGWLPIFWYPARLSLAPASLLGWLCGALAIGSSAVLLSRLWLYFRVSHWFDAMSPRIVGWFWAVMYRASDNPEFLPAPEKKPDDEKAIF